MSGTKSDRTDSNTDSVAHFLSEWKRQRPDLDPRPAGIFARMYRLSNRIARRAERYLAPHGLNWEAFSMIVTLRRAGPPYELRPRDILREGLLSSGAVTNRVDRVEKMGLVERRPDPADRRSVIVRLTPAGLRLADEVIVQHFASLTEAFDVLDKEERAQLSNLLAKVLNALEGESETAKNRQSAEGATAKRGTS